MCFPHNKLPCLLKDYKGNHIFEFLFVHEDAKVEHAKTLYEMDKHFDGHTWCQMITTHIANDFGLTIQNA